MLIVKTRKVNIVKTGSKWITIECNSQTLFDYPFRTFISSKIDLLLHPFGLTLLNRKPEKNNSTVRVHIFTISNLYQKAIGSFLHYETMSGGSCFSELVSRLEKIGLGKNTRTNHR